jgi:hypothetical protein
VKTADFHECSDKKRCYLKNIVSVIILVGTRLCGYFFSRGRRLLWRCRLTRFVEIHSQEV